MSPNGVLLASVRDSPETVLSNEYALVPPNGNVHHPIVEVATQKFSNEHSYLMSGVSPSVEIHDYCSCSRLGFRRPRRYRSC